MVQAEVAARRKASALFASSQFLIGRVALSSLITLAASLLGHHVWPLPWLGLLIASVYAQLIIGKMPASTSATEQAIVGFRTALSFFDTAMYAAAAAVISRGDTSLCGGFAILILMLTMLYVLMHFYMQPRLVIVLNAPCFAALLYCLGGSSLRNAYDAHPWTALVPVFGAVFTIYFFSGARRHLAKARRALVSSRAEALDKAGEAQAASRSKSEFLATMSHEIRTPLNGVLGIAQIMARGDVSDEQRAQLAVIRESGETLLVILNDLLDFSKIEAGKVGLESAPFSLMAVAKSVHATFSAAASAKDIGFRLSMADGAGGVYRGDEARLKQILFNLASNAVKFTAVGEVCVSLAYNEPLLSLSVQDTGIGVAEDRKAALFEKFVQADASTTRRYGGTGLGLSIVHQLVEMMGGRLILDSKLGEGSTFTAEIPLLKLSSEAPPPAPDQDVEPLGAAAAGADLQILVAEDNATNQLVIKMMLAETGVEPFIANNGREAVEAWERQAWDIVLMDVQMPEMDGLAATRAIRARELETGRPRVPILALTANAMTHQRADCLVAGMDELVAKPIHVPDLFQALDAALSSSSDVALPSAA